MLTIYLPNNSNWYFEKDQYITENCFFKDWINSRAKPEAILHGKNSMNMINAIEGGCFEQKKQGFFCCALL